VPDGLLRGLKLDLAWLGGLHHLMAPLHGGAGAILKFERVRPSRRGAFQPLRSREITPGGLDALLRKLPRWNYEVVGIDEVCRRAEQAMGSRRFVCLTFDGGSRDLVQHAYPVLSRHEVPFTVYLPTAFPDGLGEAWWLALEAVIASRDRISLSMDHREQHFEVAGVSEKTQLFELLSAWLRALPPQARSDAIHDLCLRYSVDLAALSREASMSWDDVRVLAADPLVTIGSATVSYVALSSLTDAAALREITMGGAVTEAALGRDIDHFAFPFGDELAFSAQHVTMTRDAGLVSAVTSVPGVVQATGRSDLHALPRLAWDGCALRRLRVLLSGVGIDATP
jgi:peptidoglycan/xylan/chitin deacetylase (PgdA/CDA1 family)